MYNELTDIAPEWAELWDANQEQQLTNEGFVEVLYKISDPILPEITNPPTSNGELSDLSDVSIIALDQDRVVAPYATLEQDLWRLDGSKITKPAQGPYGYSGYISNHLCNESKVFSPIPKITITFSEEVKILRGLTISWGEEPQDCPSEFIVNTYASNGEIVNQNRVDNTNNISLIIKKLENFKKLEILITKWMIPNRRARIGKIFLGVNKKYTKSNLLQFSCMESIDPISSGLPKYSIQFELDNRDGEFDPFKEDSLLPYMMEKQELRTRYGYMLGNEEVYIPGGVYYLSEWSAPQNGLSASFQARDLLGFMDEIYYKGTFQSKTLEELAQEVLNAANLPKDREGNPLWELDESLKDIETTAPLPVCSLAECLQLIANAGCCTIYFDRQGRLIIGKLHTIPVGITIDDNHSYSKPEISLDKQIKQFDVSWYSHAKEANKELYKGTVALKQGINEFMINYSDISEALTDDDIQITPIDSTVTVTVAANTEYYAKCCKLVLNSSAETDCEIIIVTKTAFKPTESIYTVPNDITGEILPLKNPLITTKEHAIKVGDWLKANLSGKKNVSLDWRIDPRMCIGDIVNISRIAANNHTRIVSSNMSFSGAFKGKIEGVVLP